MPTLEQLMQYYQRLGLSGKTREVIDHIRSSPPARRVRSGKGNVAVRYPSRKMGCVIQAESHKNKLAGIYEKEYDPDVLKYYDQPETFQLAYRTVQQATFDVHAQEGYPTKARVTKQLGNLCAMRNPDIRSFWRDAIRELGLEN